jgi:uncharacterized surface protein with fasciclin (FAS1) repeats
LHVIQGFVQIFAQAFACADWHIQEKRMKIKFAFVMGLLALSTVMVSAKDKAEVSSQDIVDFAAASPDFSTLVTAVKAAGLVDTLKGAGPFTVFAPTDEAFAKLPAGTVETLVKPENKETLTKILTYHVVSGRVTAKQLIALIKKNHGKASIKTVQGGTLTASLSGSSVILTDEKGGTATVTKTDVFVKNGVIHVIDTVVMPN